MTGWVMGAASILPIIPADLMMEVRVSANPCLCGVHALERVRRCRVHAERARLGAALELFEVTYVLVISFDVVPLLCGSGSFVLSIGFSLHWLSSCAAHA